jgi:ATP-dependent DNA ligase
MLDRIMELLEPRKRRTPPIEDPELARHPEYTWFEPEIVCEVEYLEITKSTHKMRAPTFKGLRPDKTPDECILEVPRTRTTRARAREG